MAQLLTLLNPSLECRGGNRCASNFPLSGLTPEASQPAGRRLNVTQQRPSRSAENPASTPVWTDVFEERTCTAHLGVFSFPNAAGIYLWFVRSINSSETGSSPQTALSTPAGCHERYAPNICGTALNKCTNIQETIHLLRETVNKWRWIFPRYGIKAAGTVDQHETSSPERTQR